VASPQFPPKMPRRDLHEVPKLEVSKRKAFPWPLIALLVAAVIIILLIVHLPSIPKVRPGAGAAQAPPQPTPNQVQFTDLRLTAAPTGNAFYLDGLLFNNSKTDITGVQVQVSFLGGNGQVIGSETRPVGEMGEHSDLKSEDLVQHPIKPAGSRPVRIYLDHAPADWNKQLP
jgi:hypothetical protein